MLQRDLCGLVLVLPLRCALDSYTHESEPLQVHGHAVEPPDLQSDATDSEDEVVLPQFPSEPCHSSADTQL